MLLVEDEVLGRSFAARGQWLRGFMVLEAACGKQAFKFVWVFDLEGDLFVMNVVITGPKGTTRNRKSLQARSDKKVIFLSCYVRNVWVPVNCQRRGC